MPVKLRTITSLGLVLFLLGACGEPATGPDTSLKFDTAKPDTSEDVGADGQSDAQSEDTTVADTGPDVDPELACKVDADCEGKVEVGNCEVAACVDEQCVVAEDEICCTTVDQCYELANTGKMFPEFASPCLDLVCLNNICQLVTVGEDCCTNDSDCQDQVENCCQTAVCEEYECKVSTLDDCCETSADCDDGTPSTNDICYESCVQNGCLHKAPACSVDKVYVDKAFDDGTLQLLKVTDSNLQDDIGWHVSTATSVSPPYSLHMGHKSCPHYYNGPVENCKYSGNFPDKATPMNLRLETNEFAVDPGVGSYLGFWVRMAAKEAFPGSFDVPPVDIDYLRVLVVSNNTSNVVWKSTEAFGVENTTNGEWDYQAVNLSSYTGQIKVVFEFISYADNNYYATDMSVMEGVYIDDIQIKATCAEAYCNSEDTLCESDGNGCTNDKCTVYANSPGGVCAYPKQVLGEACQPCGQPADCGTNPCYDYACEAEKCSVQLKDECCEPYSVFPETTVAPETAVAGFESGNLDGWTVEDDTQDNVTWQITQESPFEGTYAIYFGDPSTGTYEAYDANGIGQPAKGTVWTKTFLVTKEQYRTAMLTFWLHMSTEYDGTQGPGEGEKYDTLTVKVQKTASGEVVDAWSSAKTIGNTTDGKYEQIGVDLNAYENQYIRLGFHFDTGDAPGTSNGNAFGGIRIDNIALNQICGITPCKGSADCDDGDLCTNDYCALGQCANVKENPLCCTVTADCDDANECTVESCVDSECQVNYDEEKENCCSEGPWAAVFPNDFESGLGSLTVESDSLPVTWFIDEEVGFESSASIHFASPSTGKYNLTGESTSGRIITAPVLVPPYSKGHSFVEFMLHMETEWTAAEKFQAGFSYIDELSIRVKVGDTINPEPIWTSHFTQNSTFGAWIQTRADLTAYSGQEVQLIIEFNSFDSNNNIFAGPYIDNLKFGTTCEPAGKIECISGSDCPNAGDCGLATCTSDFQCAITPKDTPQCCEPTVIEDLNISFDGENPTDGWTFNTCEPGFAAADPTAKWQIGQAGTAGKIFPKEGTSFLYFGNGTDYGAVNNKGACGTAKSPEITLTEGTPWKLKFWSYVDIEKDPSCDAQTAPWADKYDVKIIEVETGEETVVWSKADIGCNEYGKWMPREIDLADYVGKTIQIFMGFTTWDNANNDGSGLGIDSIEFEKGCVDPE